MSLWIIILRAKNENTADRHMDCEVNPRSDSVMQTTQKVSEYKLSENYINNSKISEAVDSLL